MSPEPAPYGYWPLGHPISETSAVGTFIDWVFNIWHGWSYERIVQEVPFL